MTRRAELFAIPEALAADAWKDAERWLAQVPGLDLPAQRVRLLKGEDKLWAAILLEGSRPARVALPAGDCIGIVITRVTETPPASLAKPFPRTPSRSLTVHLASGVLIETWIASAVERITAYAKQQNCRQLFLLARQGWRCYATKFYSNEFEAVGYSRDRPAHGSVHYPFHNKIGHYRLVQPVKGMTTKDYNSGSLCRFEERCV